MFRSWQWIALAALAASVLIFAAQQDSQPTEAVPEDRREVVFWHFWGGKDRPVVEEIVRRFNESQDEHFVRAIAMPGQNLDMKFFLSVTGGDPPDLLNQDDPIVADWAHRGALTPLDELATAEEMHRLKRWLFPAAKDLGSYRGRLYALCNGLDIRLLYYNKTLLDEHGLSPPRTLSELNRVAENFAPEPGEQDPERLGFLPEPRMLWAWGIVFGGDFYDEERDRVTPDHPRIVAALEWMASFRERYGAAQLAAFRQGDVGLAGSSFALLGRRGEERYALATGGQWRVRDIVTVIERGLESGLPVADYGVLPLPPPEGGRSKAGWVNGNFFIVPRGAKNPAGAWAFMKFWSGFGDNEAEAAETCVAGGWIPASQAVVEQPEFQAYLDERRLFRPFVEVAKSPHQEPTPSLPVAMLYRQEVISAAEAAMYRGADPREVLSGVARRVQDRLEQVR